MDYSSQVRKYFALRILGYALVFGPFLTMIFNANDIASQKTPNLFLFYIVLIAVSSILGQLLSKKSHKKLMQLKEEIKESRQATSQIKFIYQTINFLPYLLFIALPFLIFGGLKNSEKGVSTSLTNDVVTLEKKLEPRFKEQAHTTRLNTNSYWGTCTFVLFKADGKSGGTKISDTVPNCIQQFKEYFGRYACKGPKDPYNIKTGQLNFGKKLNYERHPAAADTFVLLEASCK